MNIKTLAQLLAISGVGYVSVQFLGSLTEDIAATLAAAS
jgi:hypothetical protein